MKFKLILLTGLLLGLTGCGFNINLHVIYMMSHKP
jgi:outer membrane lipopolysaccharide assembly protein LptE/RlpB